MYKNKNNTSHNKQNYTLNAESVQHFYSAPESGIIFPLRQLEGMKGKYFFLTHKMHAIFFLSPSPKM